MYMQLLPFTVSSLRPSPAPIESSPISSAREKLRMHPLEPDRPIFSLSEKAFDVPISHRLHPFFSSLFNPRLLILRQLDAVLHRPRTHSVPGYSSEIRGIFTNPCDHLAQVTCVALPG